MKLVMKNDEKTGPNSIPAIRCFADLLIRYTFKSEIKNLPKKSSRFNRYVTGDNGEISSTDLLDFGNFQMFLPRVGAEEMETDCSDPSGAEIFFLGAPPPASSLKINLI